jgi:hypothetical protein
METNSPASTNGAEPFLLAMEKKNLPVSINVVLDPDHLVFDQEPENLYTRILEMEKISSPYITRVELVPSTGTLTQESATTAYAEYRTVMISSGHLFRPFNQWLALIAPQARGLLNKKLQTRQDSTFQQTTA